MSHRGNKREFRFDSTLAEDLRQLRRQEQTSLFTIFAAALNTLLYRYTGQEVGPPPKQVAAVIPASNLSHATRER